jgi:predicted MFS family arabinose efflux permease
VPTSPRPEGQGSLLIALGMSAGPLVALGLARFAYALLLPAMRDDLAWSYSAAGTLNTANAAGYLVGALAAAPLAARVGARRCFVAGIALTAMLLLATAATNSLGLLAVIRFGAGVTGALSFVVGGGLIAEASHRASKGRAAVMLGLYFGGAGIGIVLAGLLVPTVLAQTASWRLGWVVLAAIAVGALVVSLAATRRLDDPAPPEPGAARWNRSAIGPVAAAYTCFGLGYIAYLTFVIALLTDRGFGSGEVAAFWTVVGVAAAASGFVWGPVLGRLPGGRGMAVIMAVLAVGTALPVWLDGAATTYVSGLLVGGSFVSVVTAMTVAVRQVLPQPHWTAGMAYATVGFGLGQTVGPVLTGWVSDRYASLTSGFLVSAVVLVVGVGLALAQPTGRLSSR